MFPARLVSTKSFFAEELLSAETISDRTSGITQNQLSRFSVCPSHLLYLFLVAEKLYLSSTSLLLLHNCCEAVAKIVTNRCLKFTLEGVLAAALPLLDRVALLWRRGGRG